MLIVLSRSRLPDFCGEMGRCERTSVYRDAAEDGLEDGVRGELEVRSLNDGSTGEREWGSGSFFQPPSRTGVSSESKLVLLLIDGIDGCLVMPGIATPPFPNTGWGDVIRVRCSNCVGSWASCCGACFLSRGPAPLPPMNCASDMGSLLVEDAEVETTRLEAKEGEALELDTLDGGLALRMNLRMASSCPLCLSETDLMSSEVAPSSSPNLDDRSLSPKEVNLSKSHIDESKNRTEIYTASTTATPITHTATSTHPRKPGGSYLFFQSSVLCFFVCVDLLLQSPDSGCPL